ncbi:Sec23/Sec24 family protein-like protein [Paraphaeosphaeria sporulosa]|uniref:Sec23/Sec24 family protein-like protein n=1 Tax=Paraphaeosphaeria sporulosa TaxID=1460663 RepID=A0A177C796_9PLEO|nr:Sec23/Sec24 family protein-like protein [Paraphaeosphaeria sporulosa]OAG03513.1 Sec23/Sec24 family protein-like protein [Paraphaeosphaeria sporulosa]
MSEFTMYHALGQGSPNPNGPPRKEEPKFRPPVAAGPTGYQQTGSPAYGQTPSQYVGTPNQVPTPGQQQGYFPPQDLPPRQAGQSVDTLAQQVGGMGLGAEQTGTVRHKKKDRHAYHNIEGPAGSPQAFNGMPQSQNGTPNQFLNSPQVGGPQWAQPEITPAMNQFPAAAPMFSPSNPATGMQHAARTGDQLQGSPASSQQGRVDPEQIPSIPRSRDAPAKYYLEHVYPTMEHHLPPPALTPFVAFDQGNSSPKFARLTLNSIPNSADALGSTHLPLGLVLQPLAKLQEGEQPIPVLDFGDTGPPRCRRCRTYINPFMQFKSGGNKFVCNMCTYPNDVPAEYFAPTDPSGVRVDRLQRPELTLGTVDFMVPREYWSKEPVGLRWLFLIDVSAEAVNRGFLDGFCEGIISALYGRENEQSENAGQTQRRLPEGAKVGIVTFDKEMHFYNLSHNLEAAQMLVMPDLEEPFVPLSEGLFVDPEESKAVITSLLTQLPNMFSEFKNPEPALLPTLSSAVEALAATGGKIVCSLAALPTWGPGRLFLRDDGSMHNNDAEKKLLTTEHPGFKKVAQKMVESGVGVDFFMAAPSGGYLDIATIGHVSATTGGEIFYYPNFHSPRDTLKLSKEIKHTVTRETGYQALMKVRCSNGLQVSAYHGNFYHHTFGADLEFGVIDADKSIGVMFSYDGKLDPKLDAHFQAALLYTTASGQRRVRCINNVASVSERPAESLKFVDQDAVVTIIAKEAAARMAEKNLKDLRAALTEKTVDILAGYRKNFTGHNNPPGQLVLPENLKELSMYILGLVKSRAFKGGKEPTDRRVHDMRLLKSMSPLELSLYLYPRIISIHNLDEKDGFANENGHLRMPEGIRASFSKVEEGGVYIVDNGQICLLWLHAQVSPNLLQDLFGEGHDSLKSLDPFVSTLPVLETHLNAQVRNILQYLEDTRGSKALTLQMARQGLDGAEYEFARLLYEDRNNEAQSYVDWLVHVHRHIQLELAGQRKKEDSDGGLSSTFVGLRTPYWG